MPDDFIIVPNASKLPTDKEGQIALILHQSVRDALYRMFQSTAPLSRLTDYSNFFTVSYDDLFAHLHSHPDEFHNLLSDESWDGESVVREGQVYTFRDHFRGLVVRSERVEGIDRAIARWLRWRLRNQGLQKLAGNYTA